MTTHEKKIFDIFSRTHIIEKKTGDRPPENDIGQNQIIVSGENDREYYLMTGIKP